MDGLRRFSRDLAITNLDVKITVGYHDHILLHAKRRYHLCTCAGACLAQRIAYKPSYQIQDGAKHSPPGGKFQKSGGPPVAGGETPFHQVSYCQIVSK